MIDFEVDDLLLYFGDDYIINDKIRIHQPLIGEIVSCEREYFSMVHTLTAIPSDMKSQLWDMGLDWCELEDFDLFIMLSQTMTPDKTGILFGDLDFSKMRPYRSQQNDEVVLADKESGVIIDKLIYKIKNAEKTLSKIGEEEGFIVPTKGVKAIILNKLLPDVAVKILLNIYAAVPIPFALKINIPMFIKINVLTILNTINSLLFSLSLNF